MIICNKDSILIKNYKSIKYMDSSCIHILMDDYDISIYGKSLEIDYYHYDELKMKGTIKEIKYGYRI